jgi:hypothetical protein
LKHFENEPGKQGLSVPPVDDPYYAKQLKRLTYETDE